MAGAEFAGQSDGAGDIDPAGRAQGQALVPGQIEDDRQGLGVLDAEGMIDRDAFKIAGDAVDADALGHG